MIIKRFKAFSCMILFILPLSIQAQGESLLPKKTVLPADLALKMLAASITQAQAMHLNVSISILDDSGNTKAFVRMDGSPTGTIKISKLKASTSANLKISSRVLAERSAQNPNHAYNHFPSVITLPGGLPIKTKSGEHIGGIGVSGASSDQDEVIAQAGIDSIKFE